MSSSDSKSALKNVLFHLREGFYGNLNLEATEAEEVAEAYYQALDEFCKVAELKDLIFFYEALLVEQENSEDDAEPVEQFFDRVNTLCSSEVRKEFNR